MFDRVKLRYVLLAATAALCLALIVWSYAGRGGEPSPSRPADQTPAETQSASPEHGDGGESNPLTHDQVMLDRQVRAFSPLYFSLPPASSPDQVQEINEQIREKVTPYATEHFLQTARFGYGSSEADYAMLEEGAALKAKPLTGLVGFFLDRNTARGVVKLHVTKYDRGGHAVTSFNYDQFMTWVRQGDTWLIYEAPRT